MIGKKTILTTTILSGLMVAITFLTACAASPTPQTVEKVVTQVVEKEVTTVVESTVQVEKEVVVTATPAPQQIVEFASFYPTDSPTGKEIRLLGHRFEEENPQCKFVFTEYPGPEAYQAVTLRAQEGDPPDIRSGGGNSLAPGGGEEWKAGYIYDLAEDMQTPAYGETEGTWFDTFNAAAQEQMSFDGHVGEVPYQQTQVVLWYNTDHYEQFNLEPPRTWGDLMANCEVLKQNGIACIGGGGFNGYIGYWYDMILFRLMGNEKQRALYQGTDESVKWTDPEPLQAAQMLREMIDNGYAVEGFVGGDFTANQVAYFSGAATHLFIGTWLMGEMKDAVPEDFHHAVTYFPTIEGYEEVTPYEAAFGFLNSYAVYNPGANAREEHSTACAVDFLKLYTSKEVQTGMVKSLDYVSTIKDVPGPENIPGIGELLDTMELWFPATQNLNAFYPELNTKHWENLTLLAGGELSPEDFVARQQADWDDVTSR